MSAAATVYAVFASQEEAERIGCAAVEQRLAACVNILAPCRSIYRWDGAIETAQEVPALFKTAHDRAEMLAQFVTAMHSYDVPAVTIWEADSVGDYGAWISAETRP